MSGSIVLEAVALVIRLRWRAIAWAIRRPRGDR
jgi:hypothetical protein